MNWEGMGGEGNRRTRKYWENKSEMGGQTKREEGKG
jgi:hypothetical protein